MSLAHSCTDSDLYRNACFGTSCTRMCSACATFVIMPVFSGVSIVPKVFSLSESAANNRSRVEELERISRLVQCRDWFVS